jgi:kumamolisin
VATYEKNCKPHNNEAAREKKMKVSKCKFLLPLLALGLVASTMADTPARVAVPFPTAATPKAVDLGALEAQAADTPIEVTLALKLQNPEAAEQLLKSLNTPGDPQYRQFLSADEFVARFAPSQSDVAKIVAALGKYGLSAVQTTATTLAVTGLPANMERAFSVSLHNYQVPAHGNASSYSFHAPLARATIPAEISASVSGLVGLDNRPSLHPFNVPAALKSAPARLPATPGASLSPFGSLTVTDFANLYDVQPLYNRGVTGEGRTIGIMSLAGFTPSDAFAYWSALGLKVNPNRIQVVNVDGGPGAPSDASGSLETTLDVEQSGGVAPGANIIVYLAPNTNQAFVDIFAAAIDANNAESVSISWGEWEWFDNLENGPVTDPATGRTVSSTQAIHELLVRAGIQGQSVITAAGDGGAYEVNDDLACYGPYSPSQPDSCSLTLSVDYPASDPAITAGGGTTLPGTQTYCLNSACTAPFYVIDLPHQRVWGWDYLEGLCAALDETIAQCGIFAGGGGGGVSITFEEPSYQFGVFGVQLSQPGQVFRAGSGFLADDIGLFYALPAFYPGRNVPDVSFNADPQTGYIVYYTSSVTGYGEQPGWGGTSFVAPELNGVSALLGQYVQGRIGLLNYPLYGARYINGSSAPLHPIAYGDNWFYYGSNGYNPAAGLGTLDVANFAQYLRNPF